MLVWWQNTLQLIFGNIWINISGNNDYQSQDHLKHIADMQCSVILYLEKQASIKRYFEKYSSGALIWKSTGAMGGKVEPIPNEKLHTTRYNETLQGRWLLWPPRTLSKPPLSADILSWSLWQSFGLRGKQLYTLAAFWRNSVVYLPSLKPIVHTPPHDAWLLTAAFHYWLLLGGLFSKARSTCVSQWQQYDLKPQVISHDLPTPPIPPMSHMGRKGYKHSCPFFYICFICRHTFSRQSAK